MRQRSYMKPKILFPFPRLSIWHAKTNKKSQGAASSGCDASLMHTLDTSAGLALSCYDSRVPLLGAQARFFPSGGVRRMSMPLDKASLELLRTGQGAGWCCLHALYLRL